MKPNTLRRLIKGNLRENCRNVTFTSPPCLWFSCTPSPWSSTGSCSPSSSSPPGWRTPELSFHLHCRSGFPFSDAQPPYGDVYGVTLKFVSITVMIRWASLWWIDCDKGTFVGAIYQSHITQRNSIHCITLTLWPRWKFIVLLLNINVPAAAHHVARLLKVCDLVAGEADLSSSGDTFACFHVLRHRSTFTWQQRMTKTGWREKCIYYEQVGNKKVL